MIWKQKGKGEGKQCIHCDDRYIYLRLGLLAELSWYQTSRGRMVGMAAKAEKVKPSRCCTADSSNGSVRRQGRGAVNTAAKLTT